MRTTPFTLITFAALSLSTTGALAGGSWCANFGTGHSGINCTFNSMQQCQATLSGLSGWCEPNPYPGTAYGTGGTWNSAPAKRGRGIRAER